MINKFRAIITLDAVNKDEIYKGLDKVLRLYNAAGFEIKVIHVDREFKPLMDKVKDDMQVHMNYTNACQNGYSGRSQCARL